MKDLFNAKYWKVFEEYYTRVNFMEELDLNNSEPAKVKFLKNLLDKNNKYKIGKIAMKLFVDLLILKGETIFEGITENNYEIVNYEVIKNLTSNQNNYDILVDNLTIKTKTGEKYKYKLVISAKIYFEETRIKECTEYINSLMEKDKEKVVGIYISPLPDPKFPDSDKYICIEYEDLFSYLIEPALQRCSKEGEKLLNDYLNSFKTLYYFDYYDDIKTIPLCTRAIINTINLYNLNYEVIDEYVKNTKECNDFLLRVLLSNMYKISINTELNDKIKYLLLKEDKEIDGKLYKKNTDFIYNVFKYLIDNKIIKTYNDLEKINITSSDVMKMVIPFNEKDKYPYNNCYKVSNEKETPLVLEDKTLAYCFTINRLDIEKFVDNLHKVYPKKTKCIKYY